MSTPKGTVPWNKGTGHRWIDPRGYCWRYVTEGGKRVARREHRLVMEQHIGRRLEPWELVHHRDGDQKNNDLENLEIMEFGTHTQEHSTGRRHSQNARRSMEAFGLMREELRRERSVKADLLAALTSIIEELPTHTNDHDWMDDGLRRAMEAARAAIAKAEGSAP